MSDATLFAAALERADPADRAAFLDVACAADDGQRRRVEALLAAYEPPASTGATLQLGPPAAADAADDPDGEEPLDFLEPPLRPDAIGRLGHYEVLNVVGRGGFGIVFRAFDDVLQRVVAIKVMSPRMAAGSPARKRFVREARAYAGVRHENVVQVHAIEADPLPYLVMEFVPGETLEGLVARSGPLPAADVVRIGVQLARGLAAAHATGLIHRDIKPANVLIENGPDRRVKITDFGLARAADDASLTQSGMIAGTPLFMAPEQAHGAALDHRADLFSLGSVLYTLAAGHPPFRAATTMAVMKRVCEDDPRPIPELIPEAPPGLCAAIARLHAKDPGARIQTAAEAAELLEKSLSDGGRSARPVARAPGSYGRYRHFLPVAAAALVGAAVAAYLALPGKPPAADGDPPPASPPPGPAALPPPLPLPDLLALPDWEWGAPENLGPGVNGPGRDLMATLTADEKDMVFVRGRELWTARRAGPDEPFVAAVQLSVFGGGDVIQNPTLTGDGLLLAFASMTSATRLDDVWVATRASRAEPFRPAERLPAPVNAGGYTSAPVLSPDGLTLLATRVTVSGPGKGDIVSFTRPTRNDPFARGTLLPPPVNSPDYDAAAWLSDDGRVLAWTRMERPPHETRFHVRASRAEAFGPPQSFSLPGVSGEVGRPWLSPDGMRLYFHSRELPGGAGDLDLWVSRRVPKKK